MNDAPLLSSPPQLSGDDAADRLQIVYWILGIFIALATPIVGAIWAWRVKNAESTAQARRESAEREAARQTSDREILAEHYKREADQQAAFYASLMEEVKALRSDNRKLRDEVGELKREVRSLEEKLQYYERNPANSHARTLFAQVMNSLQTPAWVHDIGNNHWYLNDAYCAAFHVTRKDFWTPVNIYGLFSSADAAQYAEKDLGVIKANSEIKYSEKVRVRLMDPHCEEFRVANFRKVPIYIGEQAMVFGEVLGWEESNEQ